MTAITHLPWRGVETVVAACEILASSRDLELKLPAGYHHAVATRFPSETNSSANQNVNVAGGVELLNALARIDGLQALAQLESVADRVRVRVQILSPSPTVLIQVAHAPER